MGFFKMFANPFVGYLCAVLFLYCPEISKSLFRSSATFSLVPQEDG